MLCYFIDDIVATDLNTLTIGLSLSTVFCDDVERNDDCTGSTSQRHVAFVHTTDTGVNNLNLDFRMLELAYFAAESFDRSRSIGLQNQWKFLNALAFSWRTQNVLQSSRRNAG